MTIMAPEAVGESLDPRDPLLRLRTFFDEGSVELLHERDRSGVLAGAGTVNGVRTVAFCTDGTVMGGAMGVEGCQHIVNAYDTAIEEQAPIVGIWHSGGARLAEGVKALHAVGLVFEAMIRASGYIPQISVVVGFAAGGAAYGPALTDVVIMAPRAGCSSPDPTWSAASPARTSTWRASAAPTPTTRSRACATSSPTTSSTRTRAAAAWSATSASRAISTAARPRPARRRKESARRAYDVHPLVEALLDADSPFEEFQSKWAPSMVIGWAGWPGAPSACWPTTRCAWAAA
jgi:acetyl-CoA/propionyl-CoA carboxylase carboxyl transferase subunit